MRTAVISILYLLPLSRGGGSWGCTWASVSWVLVRKTLAGNFNLDLVFPSCFGWIPVQKVGKPMWKTLGPIPPHLNLLRKHQQQKSDWSNARGARHKKTTKKETYKIYKRYKIIEYTTVLYPIVSTCAIPITGSGVKRSRNGRGCKAGVPFCLLRWGKP